MLEKELKVAGVPDYVYNLTGYGKKDDRLCMEKSEKSGLFIIWKGV